MGEVSPLGSNLHRDRLATSALRGIWEQVKPLLKEEPLRSEEKLHLAETFALIELSIPESLAVGSSMPRFHGKWISLLSNGRGRPLYALSTPIGPRSSDWLLLEVAKSTLGDELLRCLEFVEKHIKSSKLVRVLRIPEHRLTALFLKGRRGCRVVVASAPVHLECFEVQRIYKYERFISLIQESTPIRALTVRSSPVEHHPPTSFRSSPRALKSRVRKESL